MPEFNSSVLCFCLALLWGAASLPGQDASSLVKGTNRASTSLTQDGQHQTAGTPGAGACPLSRVELNGKRIHDDSVAADSPRPFPQPDRIRYDRQCLTIDGQDRFIYSGAFHYFRCPKELWRARFQKIKDAGFNCVETYAAWNLAEPEPPSSLEDFSKVNLRDFDDWMTLAESFGFNIIVRPGPYICAEWDGGGYPQWLVALKKPANPLRHEAWLRTDDPVYLAWCKHWYDAVCPVIARHQVTHKAPGQPGVILFQIENEYDFVNLPGEVKLHQLEALARDATTNGIDVPLITCCTKQIRGVTGGPLRGVFDCLNFYPLWKIEKDMRGKLAELRAQQPDAPLITTELQGGWFAKVGGTLSEQQDGVTAAQIQNLTLFAIQNGDTVMNYYMLFGGANYDDWAARDLITSYDYNAPIRECGGVGDRYQRVWAIGHMLQEHGARLARAETVEIEAQGASTNVEFAERRAKDGSRYIFVRTEKRDGSLQGTAHLREKDNPGTELVFDYQLDPFGSKILYLPPGVNDGGAGEWLPKPAAAIARPTDLPAPVHITRAQRSSNVAPADWMDLNPGQKVEELGVFNRHFLCYRVSVQPGSTLAVPENHGNGIVAFAKGKLLPATTNASGFIFSVPSNVRQVSLLYENAGQMNFGAIPGLQRLNGLDTSALGKGIKVSADERERGLQFSQSARRPRAGKWTEVAVVPDVPPAPDALLTWYRLQFALPDKNPRQWVPWQLHLEAGGNGFLYLNGHCLGRYWQAGPQHDYYLPECWMNFGPGQTNVLALDLRPVNQGVALTAAVVEPIAQFAENR